MLVAEAPIVWNSLKGLICVYKPTGISCERIRKLLISNICKDLNQMECRPPSKMVAIEGDPLGKMVVKVEENLADHPLVVGPRYQEQDVAMSWSNYLGTKTSGVLMMGVRGGTKSAKYLRENKPTRTYQVKATLGKATENAFIDGKIIEKSTWRHVRRSHLEQLLSSMQAAHQRKMYELSGVDLQSQSAYDLAVSGLIRPADSKIPMIYGIKCIEYEPPNFTLEIQSINEYQQYMFNLIHEIGIKLHSTAHCTGLKCIRHSCFNLDHALLLKHCNLQNIISNMEMCKGILEENEYLLKNDSAVLRS